MSSPVSEKAKIAAGHGADVQCDCGLFAAAPVATCGTCGNRGWYYGDPELEGGMPIRCDCPASGTPTPGEGK